MRRYQDIVPNLTQPRSIIDRTAVGVLDALTATTGTVPTVNVDVAIRKNGGDPLYKATAIKSLRNIGYPIIAHKQRHLSWYKLAGMPKEYEDHRGEVIREAYSRQVTICRELAGAVAAVPADLSLGASLRYSQMTAIALGTDPAVGKTIVEVMAEVQVLTP